MNKWIWILLLSIPAQVFSQTSGNTRILLGKCNTDSLRKEPFSSWFNTNYEEYIPVKTTVAELLKQDVKNAEIAIFFGTWCGDSKREVPRLLKLLSDMSFPTTKIRLIALGGSDSLLKQSPKHEEAGLGIYRVPTVIVYENGMETGRINEFPVYSLESDLLAILKGQPFPPNYYSFHSIRNWMNDGTLADKNVSIKGLAQQLRILVADENELNSLGHLMLKQGKKEEALKIFQVNNYLFPESSRVALSLGESYLENLDFKKAVSILERSLELNKDPRAIKDILAVLYKAKEKS